MEENVLEIDGLSVSFFTLRGEVKAVRGVSLKVPAGKTVGIVGESGCGKSVTARAVMGLVRFPGRITQGRILLDGRDITHLRDRERCALCGSQVSMIFQEPLTSLNPVLRIGRQIEEAFRVHSRLSREEAARRTVELLASVGVPEPEKRCASYPHQLSGGLRQRVMIAMAMACRPRLLIADEPTTALDVTVGAQILRLMKSLCAGGTSILLISHDLGVIAQLCDYVYVMYAGQVVEEADVHAVFDRPAHPYTEGLLRAVSSLRQGGGRLDTIPGTVPNLLRLPGGCSFAERCGRRGPLCGSRPPELADAGGGRRARCHLIGGDRP